MYKKALLATAVVVGGLAITTPVSAHGLGEGLMGEGGLLQRRLDRIHDRAEDDQEWAEKRQEHLEGKFGEKREITESFLGDLTQEERDLLKQHHEEMRKARQEYFTSLTGLEEGEMKERIMNGEKPRDILEEEGLDGETVREQMREYMRSLKEKWEESLQENNPELWQRLQDAFPRRFK